MRKPKLLIVLVLMAVVAASQNNKPQTSTNLNLLTSSSKLVYQMGTLFLLFSAEKGAGKCDCQY